MRRVALLSILLVAACAAPRNRNPVPAEFVGKARIAADLVASVEGRAAAEASAS